LQLSRPSHDLGGKGVEKGILEKYRRPDVHDRKPGPVQCLLGEPMQLLLGLVVVWERLISETVIWKMFKKSSKP
jgi:hypothetical protein